MDDLMIIELYFARDEQAIEETDTKYGKLCFHIQAGLIGLPDGREKTILPDESSAFAQLGKKQQPFAASFSAGASATAGTIGYAEEVAPTLKGSPSGNCMPSVI